MFLKTLSLFVLAHGVLTNFKGSDKSYGIGPSMECVCVV